jgi:hypothetical protein
MLRPRANVLFLFKLHNTQTKKFLISYVDSESKQPFELEIFPEDLVKVKENFEEGIKQIELFPNPRKGNYISSNLPKG